MNENLKKIDLPAGSDPPGFQVPSGGHFKEFSLFKGMFLVFCRVFFANTSSISNIRLH
jgi:hypothetical protein